MAHHLTFEERERISQMHYADATNTEIARELGRHASTISRELRRNSAGGEYAAVAAQSLCQRRRRERPLVRKMEQPEVVEYVQSRLVRCWSPDQIAGRSKDDFVDNRRRQISHQTIYGWIAALPTPDRERFTGYLRRAGNRRPREDRRRLTNQVSINGRPKIVDERRRFGDWEGDTIVGGRHSGAIVTLVERRSGYLFTANSCDHWARCVAGKSAFRLEPLPPRLRRTATFDNGKESADHERLKRRLDLAVYFADRYCSWRRGTNEHTNGLLRQFIPKAGQSHLTARGNCRVLACLREG